MFYFFYPAVVAGACCVALLAGFLRGRKSWVLLALAVPCFAGSPIVTFSRGAAAAVTASDIVSLALLGCLLLGLHRKWTTRQSPGWYGAASAFFALGILGVTVVAPSYNWPVLTGTGGLSSHAQHALGIPLPLLLAGFYLMKLLGLGAYAHFFCHLTVDERDLRRVLEAAVVVCCILAVGAVLTELNIVNLRLALPDENAYQGANVFGMGRAPCGRLCAVGLFLCLALLHRPAGFLTLLAPPLLLMGLLATGSRGGVLAGAAAILFLLARGGARAGMAAAIVGSVCAAGAIAAVAVDRDLLSDAARRLDLDRFAQVLQDESLHRAAGRPEIWTATLRLLEERPSLLVTGLGTFNFRYGIPEDQAFAEHAHNDYLTCLTEMGVVGLALWMAALIGVARTLAGAQRLHDPAHRWIHACLLSLLFGLMVAGLFEQTVYWFVADLPTYRLYVMVLGSASMHVVGQASAAATAAERNEENTSMVDNDLRWIG